MDLTTGILLADQFLHFVLLPHTKADLNYHDTETLLMSQSCKTGRGDIIHSN